jgi:DNA invertase Pin-like site-specific DNA recombinase
MARNITVIPARISQNEYITQKKRVAAYCRVSTDSEEQLTSYEAQIDYYTNYINNHPDYELVFCYADEGITGTNTKKRDQFNKMVDDCKAGKIDMIITKSISRFARNTLDALNYVRMLKDLGVGIMFEKESINTLDSKGEVLLTILSSLAQDESRSISENSTWGIRRRFEQGRVIVNHTKFMGYDKDKNGNLMINDEQATIVKRIYSEFLNGKSPKRIARELEHDGILNWNGKAKWHESSIKKMLSNEKYKGDALLQKTYTVDFLTKARAVNNGNVQKYYVEDSHPAIIGKDMWEVVQLEFARRKNYMEKHNIKQLFSENPLSGKVVCGTCNNVYGRVTWNSTDEKLRRIVWQCKRKYSIKGVVGCQNGHVDENILYGSFVKAFNAIVGNVDNFVDNWKKMLESDDVFEKVTAKRFIDIFSGHDKITEFDGDLFLKVVEKIVVLDGVVRVYFSNGSWVEV